MRRILLMLATSAVFGVDTLASAAPKTHAAVITESSYYVWVDSMYGRVRLPTYNLGVHNNLAAAPFSDLGASQTYDPRLNGGGVRGAIGYIMPGTTTSFEFGGSYVDAKASNSQSTSTAPGAVLLLISGGGLNDGLICNGVAFRCSTAGVLSTSYSAWQFNGKVATDWKYSSVTVTPSVAVFGGNTRAAQTLSQLFTQFAVVGGAVVTTTTYSANTMLKWRDVGGRVGLDVSNPVMAALTVGIGGWVGGAARQTSLSGNDVEAFSGSSTLSVGDGKTVFLANAQASFAYKFTPMLTFRGFAGLNYDGGVPGIAGPSYTGSILAPTSRTAASIYHTHETSLYAGGGLLVKFGGTSITRTD